MTIARQQSGRLPGSGAPATPRISPRIPARAPAAPHARDSGIDLVRASCVAVVVALHALMVGVTVGSSGPVFEDAAQGAPWFAPLTWFGQVMPLFFVIGGFAGGSAYGVHRARGGTGAGFVAARVHRLLLPATVAVGAAGIGLAVLHACGVPSTIVLTAGYRYGQPLWFLGVFLLCQLFLPVLSAVHARRPFLTLGVLIGSALLVDPARGLTGVAAVGYLNLAFVWLALQQFGLFLRDGRIDALRVRTRALGALAAAGILVVAMLCGAYSPNLIDDLNPPTVALLLVGAAQTALFSLLRGPIERLSHRRPLAAFTRFVTARTMTIYLWHMPVLLAMAGLSAIAGMNRLLVLPAPSSLEWWLGRPLWLGLAVLLVGGVASAAAGLERRRPPALTASPIRATQAAMCGIAGVVLLLAVGTTVITATIAVALFVAALASIRPLRRDRCR